MSLNDTFDFVVASKNITIPNAFNFAYYSVLIGQSEWYKPSDVIKYCEWAKTYEKQNWKRTGKRRNTTLRFKEMPENSG